MDVSHPDAPVVFLFYHAIELYLKAYVRSAGYNLQQLKEISHKTTKAGKAAKQEGLQLTDDDLSLLDEIDSYDNVIRSRYITTGAYTRPEDELLARFCERLDNAVAERLAADGHPVRSAKFKPPAQPAAKKSIEEHLDEEIKTLSKKEREIIAYLLHHNQRMFTGATDGGHASTLLSRGIVRQALRPGQVFAFDDLPVEIPIEVWKVLKTKAKRFRYGGSDDQPHPWRKHWME